MPASSPPTRELFAQVLQSMPAREIAARIGLNVNTVLRWAAHGHAPENYRGDFMRLLGLRYDGGDSVRDNDQFYTKPEVAQHCYEKFCAVAAHLGVDLRGYHFIEPAAGCGWFFELLPVGRRLGIDIEPRPTDAHRAQFIRHDFLTWQPPQGGQSYAVIGNPPFGLRGHLALQFINHSRNFADLVGFILPPLFDSDGKGVPRKRVLDYRLAHSEKLPANSFAYPDGREVDVAAIFQVWTKVGTHKIVTPPQPTCKSFIRVFSLSDGGTSASTRNKKMLHACDAYLPSTCFRGMKVYADFESLPHRRGYGVVALRNKAEIVKLIRQTEWQKVAFTSTNGALNLRTGLIEKVVIDKGFADRH